MIALRIAGTLFLLMVGWLLRRRPILGPLVLLLVGLGLHKLWCGGHPGGHPDGHALVERAYRATLASHRR